MSEQEVQALKEQIKRELLAEMNTKKENENSWKRLKDEYKDEFSKFNFIDHWEFTDINNNLHTRDEEIKAEYPLQSAIGTLLRIVYKAKSVTKMNVPYEELKEIVDKILAILKEKACIENK